MERTWSINKKRSKEIRELMIEIHDVVGINYTKIGKDSGINKSSISKFMNGVFDYSDTKLDSIEESLEKYKVLL